MRLRLFMLATLIALGTAADSKWSWQQPDWSPVVTAKSTSLPWAIAGHGLVMYPSESVEVERVGGTALQISRPGEPNVRMLVVPGKRSAEGRPKRNKQAWSWKNQGPTLSLDGTPPEALLQAVHVQADVPKWLIMIPPAGMWALPQNATITTSTATKWPIELRVGKARIVFRLSRGPATPERLPEGAIVTRIHETHARGRIIHHFDLTYEAEGTRLMQRNYVIPMADGPVTEDTPMLVLTAQADAGQEAAVIQAIEEMMGGFVR
ncbi:MAG: hypothetical protein AB8H79_01170 [Myxococcota bacterium]